MRDGNRWAGLVEDADVLMVGARFGPKVRVDFLLRATGSRGAEFFKQKAASFEQMFASVLPQGSPDRRPGKALFDPDRVRGSIELSKRQFEVWGEQPVDQDTQARTLSRGE